jgi:hypothetical protein
MRKDNQQPTRTAVCLVGQIRSFSRQEFRETLKHRFLGGFGSRDTLVFAVLTMDPEDSQTRDEITTILHTEFRFIVFL